MERVFKGQGLSLMTASLDFQLTELIERVDEKTELASFMAEVGRKDCSSGLTIPMQVVTQFKIADTKKFDKTINTEDQLAALG